LPVNAHLPTTRMASSGRSEAMPKINGNQITPGTVIDHDGGLWVAVKTNAVKPGKGGAFNQVELENLIDARKLNERFRADERSRRSSSNSRISVFFMRRATRSSSWISRPMDKSSLPRIGLESKLHYFKAV
jgi:hypothetical protein